EPEHRLARELRRAGREGIREDRTGSPTVRSRGITLASPPPSAPLRDEPARCVRSRRRPRRKRQARRRRRRRRVRLHPARSQWAGPVAPPGPFCSSPVPLLKGPLGYGGAPLGNMFRDIPEEEALGTVTAAWDPGIRYFDTAPFYGAGSNASESNA